MVASIAFEAGHPLELNGGEQIVVLEQRGARVVNAGMSRENEVRHLFNASTAFRRSIALPLERYAPLGLDLSRFVLRERRSRREFVFPGKRPTGIDDRFRMGGDAG